MVKIKVFEIEESQNLIIAVYRPDTATYVIRELDIENNSPIDNKFEMLETLNDVFKYLQANTDVDYSTEEIQDGASNGMATIMEELGYTYNKGWDDVSD